MGHLVKIAEIQDIPPGMGKAVEAEGKRIAVFNVAGSFYAIDDSCSHRGGPLSEGELEGTVVTCPWHGSTFDVATGSVLRPPAPRGVARYEVKVEGNEVKVELP